MSGTSARLDGIGKKGQMHDLADSGPVRQDEFTAEETAFDNHRQEQSHSPCQLLFCDWRNERAIGVGLVVDDCVGIVRGFTADPFDPDVPLIYGKPMRVKNAGKLL